MGSVLFVEKTIGGLPGKIDSPLDERLKSVRWGEFRLGDLFEIESTWTYGKNKQYKTRFQEHGKNRVPVISGVTINNGVNYYTEDILDDQEIFSDCLTISTRGEYSGTVTYHSGQFVLANNILAMPMPNWSKNQKLFIGSIINSLPYGGYSGYPRKETLQQDIILLPVTPTNDELDFDFMESFIRELEEERVRELAAYLTVSGLADATLTASEEATLLHFEKMKWQEFRIGKLFEILSSKKRFDANKTTLVENCGHPYIVRTALNNGQKGFIDEDEIYLNDGNTISFGQDTATMFYQELPYFTGDKIKIMKARFSDFNKYIALYLITCMSKAFKHFSWGASSFSKETISSQIITLPAKNGNPDYERMALFIRAIQKLVIRDVVQYADQKIAAIKLVTNNE